MRFFGPIFLFLLCFSPGAFSQDLRTLMQQISEQVGEVIIEDDTYRQEWTAEEDQPYRATFRREEIDKKGKSTEYLYYLNLADFNDRLVIRETNRNRMHVLLRTQGQLSAIKNFKDGEQENYEKEIEIVVDGPDAADALIELLKSAIPLAIEMDEARIVPQDYNSALQKALSSVQTVSIKEDTYEQTLRLWEGELPILELEVREPSGRDIQLVTSTFNLADLSDPVNFEVRGDQVKVVLRTRGNLNYIAQTTDGEPENYQDDIEILMDGVEKARDFTKLLNYCIPEAQEKMKSYLPEMEPNQGAIQEVSDQVGEVVLGETTIQQTLEPDCQTKLTVNEADERGSSTTVFSFHLGDMNGRQAQIDVKGKNIGVSLPSNGKIRVVSEEEDGEFKGYTYEVFLEADRVETARMIEHLLPLATEWCDENRVRLAPKGGPEQKLEWVAEQLAAFRGEDGETQQELRWDSGESCNLSYEVSDGKSLEAYEFRLEDLGANKIQLDISSRELSISLGTEKDQDLIQEYKDGALKRYVNEFEFPLGDLTVARDMVLVFQELAESCKE